MNDLKSKRQSFTLLAKFLAIGGLILLLQIPLLSIESLSGERAQTKNEAIAQIANDSGAFQDISGPIITVPVTAVPAISGEPRPVSLGTARLLPDNLTVNGSVSVNERYRGIFKVQTYSAELTLSGSYSLQKLLTKDYQPAQLRWEEAVMSLGISDPHTIREQVSLSIGNKSYNFIPGVGSNIFAERGINAPISDLSFTNAEEKLHFVIKLNLTGSGMLRFQPLANNTEVRLKGNWPHPSFIGRHLPVESKISEAGFEAVWKISEFGREFSQVLPLDRYPSGIAKLANAQLFGAKFFVPVDIHSMTYRAIKYANLLILITFLTLFLFEICAGVNLHPMHSLMVGAALSIFYLLLLSLGEHLGFGVSYLISTLTVATLITGYARTILSGVGRAITLGAQIVLQYGFFYVLLSREDYALVSGSLGTTLLLGVVMYLTRNVDWARVGKLAPAAIPTDEVAGATLISELTPSGATE